MPSTDNTTVRRADAADAVATARPDILDRNGEILATDVRMPSLFGEPQRIIDVDEAVELLTAVMPDLDAAEVRERLSSQAGASSGSSARSPPSSSRRSTGSACRASASCTRTSASIRTARRSRTCIGHVNIDNQGIAGIEKWLDGRGLADLHLAGFATDRLQQPVELAVDLRVQHAMRDELIAARDKFKAMAAAGLVIDVRTGEIVAMVSVPDYDPNNPREALDPTRINRLTTGVFEMGSTFKALTIAMALDSGKMNLELDASMRACRCATAGSTSTTITRQKRVLTVPEVFTYSSNIGTARMALALGVEHHKWFLRKMGQLDRLRTELPESAEPLVPEALGRDQHRHHRLRPRPFGRAAAGDDGIGALMNGGMLDPADLPASAARRRRCSSPTRVIKPETSEKMRYLMRLNAEKGSAKRADVDGLSMSAARPARRKRSSTAATSKTQAAHHLHGGVAGRQAALSAADHARRAAGRCRRPTAMPPRAGTRRRPPARSSRASRRCSASRRASTCRRRIG